MHVYIYDTFLNDKKYSSTLARIETRVTDLGLNGKINRMSLTQSIYEIIENEIKKGAKTIIAVGNNTLLTQIINAMAQIGRNDVAAQKVPISIIPIGKKNNSIAEYFGISSITEACDILAARRIQIFDLGLANDIYFLSHAIITSQGTIVEIDKNYSIEIKGAGEIGVINLPVDIDLPNNIKPSAQDKTLELYIKTSEGKKFLSVGARSSKSIFSFNKLTIINKKQPVTVDGLKEIKTPVNITLAEEKIKIIVGKEKKT